MTGGTHVLTEQHLGGQTVFRAPPDECGCCLVVLVIAVQSEQVLHGRSAHRRVIAAQGDTPQVGEAL